MTERDDAAPTLVEDKNPSDRSGVVLPSDPGRRPTPSMPRYSYRSRLGEGGMGEVRLCDDGHIGRRVAMKLIRPEHGDDPTIEARFLREARVQGQLEHPAIVPVYDLGRTEDGASYFTMKRVRGETLDEILEALRRGEPRAVREYTRHKLLTAFAQVCLAVDFAHDRGVIHRDLKPANVMLGSFGEVYVLDWGLAKLTGEPDDPTVEMALADARRHPYEPVQLSGEAHVTDAGIMLGTPGYAAPEQIRGGDVDARTDVWALGAILFEILTLEPLAPTGHVVQMMKETLRGLDARASIRAPAREVPPELEAVCVRATAVDRAERFRSARELESRIQRYLAGDRDALARAKLAEQHLEAARVAADASARGAEEARTRALQEVGRAIALDPKNEEAAHLLLSLLTRAPDQTPDEVKREVAELDDRNLARSMPWGAIAYAAPAVLCFLPLAWLMGMRSPTVVVACVVPYVLTALLGWISWARGAFGRVLPLIVALGAIAVACASALVGPFVFVPALATLNAAFFCLADRRISRVYVIVMQCLAVLVPAVLEWTGVLPVVHSFDADGSMRITSFGVVLRRVPTLSLLTFSSLFAIAAGGAFLARFADALHAAELRRLTQVWQIRQLLPGAARGAARVDPSA